MYNIWFHAIFCFSTFMSVHIAIYINMGLLTIYMVIDIKYIFS